MRDDAGRLQIEPNAEELATVARAQGLRADGFSLRRIAEVLTSEGRKTKRGGAWRAVTVKRALERCG